MKTAQPEKPPVKAALVRSPAVRPRIAKRAAPVSGRRLQAIPRTFDAHFSDVSDVAKHKLVSAGVKTAELMKLVKKLQNIPSADLLKAIGISSKTVERNAADKLSLAHSGSALALMEIAELAENVLGSDTEAQAWLLRPAVALESNRPIDLLTTPPGIAAVKTLLQRIEYGVYS